MNKVKSFFNLYLIVRDVGKPTDPFISTGFMRQTGYPWRVGKGIQIRIKKYVVQVGVCRKNKELKEEQDGLLHAMQGRLLSEKPGDIGNW